VTVATAPVASTEIRMTTLQHATRGKNFWSLRPVTRMDLAVGAYDDISSASVPGFVDRLVGVMPGLIEHRCSIGERGGFVLPDASRHVRAAHHRARRAGSCRR
jgi:cyanophycin synthetase